jgi:thiol-disulfide isomerase/thioredoxin
MAVAAGLFTGVLAGAAMLGGILLLAPGPVPVPTDPPATVAPALPSAPAAASPSASAPSALPSNGAASPSQPAPGPSSSPVQEGFGVGEPAPALLVPRLGGGDIDLAQLRGKPVWVNFMATWCPSCVDELPAMAGFASRYSDTGLVVMAVDVREDAATVDAFMRGLGVTFPVGLDEQGTAQQAWGAYALPVHFWVDAEGIVRDGALGGIGPDVMAAGLETILPGVDVTPS